MSAPWWYDCSTRDVHILPLSYFVLYITVSFYLTKVFQKVREKFTVDDQRHYLFSPRDLTQWVVGLTA